MGDALPSVGATLVAAAVLVAVAPTPFPTPMVATPVGAPAPPPSLGPKLITQPDWLTRPTGQMMATAYPGMAMALGLGGHATIACQIDEFGKLQRCRVVEERPEGLGFGRAALSLTAAFTMRPMTVDGEPVSGSNVNIPIQFLLPPDAPEPPAPPPTSSGAMAAARDLISLLMSEDAWTEQIEEMARQLEYIERPDADDDARQVLAAAIRTTYRARLVEAREELAQLYAGAFDEAELSALVAFYRSPAGKALGVETDEGRAISTMINREYHRLSVRDAAEAFCATRECTAKDDVLGLQRDASGTHPSLIIPNPSWSQEPTEEQVWERRPMLAANLELPATARLTCIVATLGRLQKCKVAHESPAGLGVGGAATSLAYYYRLSPMQLAEGAVGETVAVFVRFPASPPSDEPAYEGLPPRSPHAMELALALLASTDNERQSIEAYRQALANWDNVPPGVSAADLSGFADAWVTGARRARDTVIKMRAADLTRRFTDSQLEEAITFWRGPVGQAWLMQSAEIQKGTNRIRGRTTERIWHDAGQALCKVKTCLAPPTQPSAAKAAPSTRTP